MGAKKVFLTGGIGFIGSFIARRLFKAGCDIMIYDSHTEYIPDRSPFYKKALKDRFKGFKNKIRIVKGNVLNINKMRTALLDFSPDAIIHLAGYPINEQADVHCSEAVHDIVWGTSNILEIVKDMKSVRRFIYTSSSMIYGDFLRLPCDENHPLNPKSVYGGAKLAGEYLVSSFGRRFGFKYTIIRPSAVYGPTDTNMRVIQKFIEAAIAGNEITVFGVDQKLDFTYVEDTAQGFVKAMFSEKAENEIFNITRGEGRTMGELLDIIKGYYPDLKIIYKEHSSTRPKRGALDIAKARHLIGFEPEYTLEAGIKKYVEYYKGLNGK